MGRNLGCELNRAAISLNSNPTLSPADRQKAEERVVALASEIFALPIDTELDTPTMIAWRHVTGLPYEKRKDAGAISAGFHLDLGS